MKALGLEVGVRFMALGFDPTTATEDVPIMPKNRYDIMRAYMPTRGTLGLDMMLRSCTIQVCCLAPRDVYNCRTENCCLVTQRVAAV